MPWSRIHTVILGLPQLLSQSHTTQSEEHPMEIHAKLIFHHEQSPAGNALL